MSAVALTHEEMDLLIKVLDGLQYNGLDVARKCMAIQEKLQSSLLTSDRADAPNTNGGT